MSFIDQTMPYIRGSKFEFGPIYDSLGGTISNLMDQHMSLKNYGVRAITGSLKIHLQSVLHA
jgi:hypothetical protein